jgi:geranylgeranyl pyrophosphate synthase
MLGIGTGRITGHPEVETDGRGEVTMMCQPKRMRALREYATMRRHKTGGLIETINSSVALLSNPHRVGKP